MGRSALGTRPTELELRRFHAYLQHGSGAAAGVAMGCSEQAINLALGRLRNRFGVESTVQLVRPLVMSPLYARLRGLERENRKLNEIVRHATGRLELVHTRVADGGLTAKKQRRHWKKARRMARSFGITVTAVDQPRLTSKNRQPRHTPAEEGQMVASR